VHSTRRQPHIDPVQPPRCGSSCARRGEGGGATQMTGWRCAASSGSRAGSLMTRRHWGRRMRSKGE
jgi:hypothetical protein